MKPLRMFLWMTLVTGIFYPLLISVIAQVLMKKSAEGDLILVNGRPVGAKLIAEQFASDHYFWGRPSAIDYNPLSSGGSNLGPISSKLKEEVDKRKLRFNHQTSIPKELLFASGSGLDPHIHPATAKFQIERIIKTRNLDPTSGRLTMEQLIEQTITKRRFGILGEPYVNVLLLNLQLDEIFPHE